MKSPLQPGLAGNPYDVKRALRAVRVWDAHRTRSAVLKAVRALDAHRTRRAILKAVRALDAHWTRTGPPNGDVRIGGALAVRVRTGGAPVQRKSHQKVAEGCAWPLRAAARCQER